MKKKFFMRGFGVGVLVTSLVVAGFSMLKSNSVNVSPTDQPQGGTIVSESPLDKETESPISAEPSVIPEETAPVTESSSQAPSATADASVVSSADPASSQTAPEGSAQPGGSASVQTNGTVSAQGTQSSDEAANSTETARGNAASEEQQKVLVEVPRGSDSYTVAKKVKESGLISDAKEFDEYLINRGYAEQITAGTYEITKGSTYEQIAKKISGISK